MYRNDRSLNLVMSGGGVKGIAYLGMFEVAERLGYRWNNIAGVSAGAIAGALAASGFSSREMIGSLDNFDFKGIQLVDNPGKLPVVKRFVDFAGSTARGNAAASPLDFLKNERGGLWDSIITYSKEGSLFDGDYLEEWVRGLLARRNVRKFGDLRGGTVDKFNPHGYKVRMTGVDLNRLKMVVLPDDATFYGVDPDEFDVARAVRVSTCVPFAFKPVEFKKLENGKVKSFNLVDGGVFDRFPGWLIDAERSPTIGFKLSGGEKYNFFSLDTPLYALKALISAVHDIGVPQSGQSGIKCIGEIDTTKVNYLDFNIDKEKRDYFLDAGRKTAEKTFAIYEHSRLMRYAQYPYTFRRFRGPMF